MYPAVTPVYDQKKLADAWSKAKTQAKATYAASWKVKYSDSFFKHMEGFNDMSVQAFAELTAEQLKAKGNELIKLLRGISGAKKQSAALKGEIMPYVINQPLETEEGTIVYVEGSEGQILNRTMLRDKMVELLKIDPARAEALLNSASSKKIVDAYLKIMNKKTPVVAKEVAPATEEKKETPNA